MARIAWLAAGLLAGCQQQAPEPACSDGTEGAISQPAGAVHVRATGDDAATGSDLDPVATLARALIVAGNEGLSRIGIGSGQFEAALDLTETLVLEGCGDDTVLVPVPSAEAPQIRVTGATDVAITGMRFDGGDRPLWFWGGAEVTVRDVTVERANWSGFLVDGPYSILELREVTVRDPQPVDGVGGYGAEVDGAILSWEGGGVEGAAGAGIVANGASARIALSGLSITGTRTADNGQFGRGVQVQDYAAAEILDSTFADNADAAVFSLLGLDITLSGNLIDGGNDGIVLTGIDATGRRLDPATFASVLEGNEIAGVSRAAIVFERVTAEANDSTVANGALHTVVAQEGAIVTGNDTIEVLATPLALDRSGLAQVGGL